MIDGLRVLGIIPARGGSKGVVDKNIRPVAGQPLLAWTIQAARGSLLLDRLILSSDDPRIIAVAAQHGCEAPFVRSEHLARDDTPGIAPVLDAIERVPGYDLVVLLQPTSPLRLSSDIDECIQRMASSGSPACVSVTEVEEHPFWMFWLTPTGTLQRIIEVPADKTARRQDLPSAYRVNGAVYVARTAWLLQSGTFLGPDTIANVMPASRSLDIDSLADFELAEAALRVR